MPILIGEEVGGVVYIISLFRFSNKMLVKEDFKF